MFFIISNVQKNSLVIAPFFLKWTFWCAFVRGHQIYRGKRNKKLLVFQYSCVGLKLIMICCLLAAKKYLAQINSSV